jgi:hypothetical protein
MSITYGPSDCIVESCDCTIERCTECVYDDFECCSECSYDGPAVADTTSE